MRAAIVTSLVGVVLMSAASAQAAIWSVGDVAVGIRGGYKVYSSAGVLKDTLPPSNLNAARRSAGCTFAGGGDLWGTESDNNRIVRYGNNGVNHPVTQFVDAGTDSPQSLIPGNGEPLRPVSLGFDALGELWVGTAAGNKGIQRYAIAGVVPPLFYRVPASTASFTVDLASDQRTVFYGSADGAVHRYDVLGPGMVLGELGNMPDFATGLNRTYTVRILPPGNGSGGVLVADEVNIKRLDAAGNVIQTYDAAGKNSWLTLALDPNGTTFWAGNDGLAGSVHHFNLASGVEIGPTLTPGTTNNPVGELNGVCVMSEPRAGQTLQLPL